MHLVAIGGGHGLSASLKAARRITSDITALVSVADDGGSSGRLREEFSILPPGDMRMAMLALAAPEHEQLAELLAHRFAGDGALGGHSLGNLVLTALWQQGLGAVAAVDRLGEFLGITGRVVPISTQPHWIVADTVDEHGHVVHIAGQANIAAHGGHIQQVHTSPESVPACPEALSAIGRADLIVLGPGSWFTSVLAPLAVDGVVAAISASGAPLVLVANTQSVAGESRGFSTADYIRSLARCHPGLRLSSVVTDDAVPAIDGVPVIQYGGPSDSGVHDPDVLAECLRTAENSLRQRLRG